MSQIPETLSGEVTDDLNRLIYKTDRMWESSAPEIRDLSAKIRKLQKVDAGMAFVRFGSLAAICGDVESVLEYYRKALLLPGEEGAKHEFWAAMGNAGLYSRAHELGHWLLEPRRGFFPQIWEKAVSKGQVQAVWTRLTDAKRVFPDLLEVDFSLVDSAAKVMREHGLTDGDIAFVLDRMGEIQREHRIMFSGPLTTILKVLRPPEEPPYLYLSMPLDTSVQEIHLMNRKMARMVVEKLPAGAFPQGLVCSFSKAAPLELRAAA